MATYTVTGAVAGVPLSRFSSWTAKVRHRSETLFVAPIFRTIARGIATFGVLDRSAVSLTTKVRQQFRHVFVRVARRQLAMSQDVGVVAHRLCFVVFGNLFTVDRGAHFLLLRPIPKRDGDAFELRI